MLVPNKAAHRLGNGSPKRVPDPATRIGARDRAILPLLLACDLRRDDLVRLQVSHLQLRVDRWVPLDLQGTEDAPAPSPRRGAGVSAASRY